MNRFVTFCIKIGVALLVLAVISNTAYAATITETADKDPTMTTGTISAGTFEDTWLDNDVTQNLLEAKIGNDYYLDCYYNLSTTIDESRIKTFEIGVYAWYTMGAGKLDSFTVYVWNNTAGSWDSTNIIVNTQSEAIYNDTITSGIEHIIRDSDGNIAIRFDDNDPGNKEATLYIDYLYVNLTYTNISGVETDKLTYKNGETITTTWTTADCCGSGESHINVEYWDVTNGTQFNLTSHATSANSSTSKALTNNEVGHTIAVYVYTTSSADGGNSTAITQGDPWPYSIPNAVQPESWESYNDAAHNNPDDTFSGDEDTVYMHGTGFMALYGYKIAYYEADTDGEGEDTAGKIETDDVDSDADGNLSSNCVFTSYPAADPGTWHAIVCNSSKSPPSTYNSSWSETIADDSFTVEESAIPEFPTVVAAIAVCMLCAVAYMVMRWKVGKKG